mmetsp:Transcript_10551/g.19163  ORF Transcript_10551/g.19163 Transcript_10551/m.19163 type:complete len:225 (+) Transcript_10551:786-1460(+)
MYVLPRGTGPGDWNAAVLHLVLLLLGLVQDWSLVQALEHCKPPQREVHGRASVVSTIPDSYVQGICSRIARLPLDDRSCGNVCALRLLRDTRPTTMPFECPSRRVVGYLFLVLHAHLHHLLPCGGCFHLELRGWHVLYSALWHLHHWLKLVHIVNTASLFGALACRPCALLYHGKSLPNDHPLCCCSQACSRQLLPGSADSEARSSRQAGQPQCSCGPTRSYGS